MKQIAAAFVKAQTGFSPALKSSTNPYFKSKYADLAACVEAVIDSLNKNGIALIQNSHECSNGVIVETIFMHESGETLSAGKLHVPATKQDAPGYGSALTYARRYSLMAACGIAPEDDDGNAASKKQEKAEKRVLSDGAVLDYLASIEGAESMDALRQYHADAFKAANKLGDNSAIKKFNDAKDKRKEKLAQEESEDIPQ